MRTRLLLVAALVVLSVALAHARPPVPRPPGRPAAPPADTFDQLVDRLAELRAQELDLLVRRADLERQVGDRLAEQSRRLQQVGVSPAAVAPPLLPPAVLVTPTPHPAVPAVSVDLPPLPVAGSGFTAGRPEFEPHTDRDRGPKVTLPASLPAELADRLDALGGLPVAYTRWWRDTTPRRAPEQIFQFGGGVMLFGGS